MHHLLSRHRSGYVLLVVLFAGAGYWWADHTQHLPSSGSSPLLLDQVTVGKGTPKSPAPGDLGNLNVAKSRMTRILLIKDPKERLRAIQELAQSIPTAAIKKWLDQKWFASSQGYDLLLFEGILRERLKVESPFELAEASLKSGKPQDLAEQLRQMAGQDPQKVIDLFAAGRLDYNQVKALSELAKIHPQLVMDTLKSINRSGSMLFPRTEEYETSKNVWSGLFKEVELAQPGLIAASLSEFPLDQRLYLSCGLIGAEMTKNPASAVRMLADRPDASRILALLPGDVKVADCLIENASLMSESLRIALADKIASSSINVDAQKWVDTDLTSYGFSAEQASAIQVRLISELTWNGHWQEVISRLDRVTDPSRKEIIISGLLAKAQNKEELLSNLSESDLVIAQKILAETTPPPKTDVATLVAAFQSEGQGNTQQTDYLYAITQFSPEELKQLQSAFAKLGDDQKLASAQTLAMKGAERIGHLGLLDNGEKARPLVADSFKYLIESDNLSEIPKNEPGRGFVPNVSTGVQFATSWAETDATAATQWLGTLPSGTAKERMQQNVLTNWIRTDFTAAQEWVNSLPAKERTQLQPLLIKK